MTDWLSRAVPQAAGLHPYVPGKPVARLLREKGIRDAVKLASNENPYGPSPAALDAARAALAGVHRYPDGDAPALREALAARHGVSPDAIVIGNGSNEVLELVIRAFAGPGDEVVYSRRGFIVYALAAQAAGARGVAVPEQDGLTHDLEAMAAAVNARTKVVAIANPNNPTGAMHPAAAIRAFLDRLPRDVVVILDEAYHEYVADDAAQDAALAHPGLVVCRTFSKAFGLAGLRVGYGVADPALVAVLHRFREPFNVNLVAQAAARAALDDMDWVRERVARTLTERARLEAALAGMGLLGGASKGNFVLLRDARAASIAAALEDAGVIVRPLAPYGMADWLRISVGRPEENDRLLDALARLVR
ncbi:MAG: histidinol-phosphate transaminase [Mariprofundaceae bacterium]